MDIRELAERLALLRQRKQVVIGDTPVSNLVRHGGAGFVLLTDDLNRTKARRLRRLCERYDVPCLQAGDSDDIGEVTACFNTRVYGLRKGAPGLRTFLLDLPDE